MGDRKGGGGGRDSRGAGGAAAVEEEAPHDFGEAADAGGDWAEANFSDWVDSLTEDERFALAVYQDGLHEKLNDYLRGQPVKLTDRDRAKLARLDEVLARGRVGSPVVVYRGIKKWEQVFGTKDPHSLVGATLTDPGFSSTTVSLKNAHHFSGLKGAVMRIHLPRGTRAGYLSRRIGETDPQYHWEKEVLLPRGGKFRVRSQSRDSKKRLVLDMEYVK